MKLRLKELRISHNYTQQQIADVLGCQREVYRRYESETRPISFQMVVKLADFYMLSLDEFVERNATIRSQNTQHPLYSCDKNKEKKQ